MKKNEIERSHDEKVHVMMMRFMVTVLFVLGLTITAQAIAQAVGSDVVAAVNPLAQSAEKVGWLSGLLALALQFAKSDLLGGVFARVDKDYQPAVVLLIGQLGALVEVLASGKDWKQACIEWLLTSGNAMAIYAVAFKPVLKKIKK